MNILVYGAGVLGSLYAARLHHAGHTVSILARGQRLADIRTHGLVLEDARTGERAITHVPVVTELAPDDAYDLVIVFMRENQVSAVLPTLAANRKTPTILFMGNNLIGPEVLMDAVGSERVILGFPGAGGLRDGYIVRYRVLTRWQQATTLGEPGRRQTPRLAQLVAIFTGAGFPVETNPDMGAWYKTHVAWTLPTTTALYMAGGDNHRMARTRDAVVLMVRAVRENFRVLRALGVPITPASLHIFEWLPEPLLIAFLSSLFNTRTASIVIAGHANAARDEYLYLANGWRALTRHASEPTPAGEQLNHYLDPAVPAVADGSATIPLSWHGVVRGAGACVGVMTLVITARRRIMR